jgi:hypothetical protein
MFYFGVACATLHIILQKEYNSIINKVQENGSYLFENSWETICKFLDNLKPDQTVYIVFFVIQRKRSMSLVLKTKPAFSISLPFIFFTIYVLNW